MTIQTCGCEQRGEQKYRCSYHEGFDDGAERRQQQILAFAEATGVRDAEYSVAGFGVHRLLKALSDPEFQWERPSVAALLERWRAEPALDETPNPGMTHYVGDECPGGHEPGAEEGK